MNKTNERRSAWRGRPIYRPALIRAHHREDTSRIYSETQTEALKNKKAQEVHCRGYHQTRIPAKVCLSPNTETTIGIAPTTKYWVYQYRTSQTALSWPLLEPLSYQFKSWCDFSLIQFLLWCLNFDSEGSTKLQFSQFELWIQIQIRMSLFLYFNIFMIIKPLPVQTIWYNAAYVSAPRRSSRNSIPVLLAHDQSQPPCTAQAARWVRGTSRFQNW
jgi:hypothetical protein